jgi:tRNA nucleotidyltransferase (CCA-adding enzyme)
MNIQLPANIENIISRLEGEGFSAFAVGGCVRDSLLGRVPKDWDVCTSARPDTVCSIFGVEPGYGSRHGTVSVSGVEVTTFRREGTYHDRRRPDSVEFVTELRDDLKRRDFTVNALAYNPSSGLTDLFGGFKDMTTKLLRCIGDPDVRFDEDCLRILRALRFSSQLGFEIESSTAEAVLRHKHLILTLPVERFFSELTGILEGINAADVLVKYSEVLCLFIPEGDFIAAASAVPGVENRLKALLGENAAVVLTRLHAPKKIKNAVCKV